MTQNELPKSMGAILKHGAIVDANFKAYLREMSGYDSFTTFASDFAIGECYGTNGVTDTFNRATKEWKSDVKYYTELCLALNHASWRWYENEGSGSELAALYSELYYKALDIADKAFSKKDLHYLYATID